ncbi:MAG: NADH-quinone oxidoreductase subunit C [Miltoncostaeaceae bacterium]
MSEVAAAIEAACPGAVLADLEHVGETTVEIAADHLLTVARFIQGAPLSFTLLSDVTCADFPEHADAGRFRLAYHLYAPESGRRVRLRVWAGAEDPEVPSVTPVWRTADWHERETYDMFGVRFAGHPDLARILMPLDWEGHPLRRDYPLGGEEVVFTDAE